MSEPALSGTHSPDQDVISIKHNTNGEFLLASVEDDIVNTALRNITGTRDSSPSDEGPPLKKRKIADEDSHKSSPRAPSPPWKKITADGPTTFLENGRRRSGRTNIIPLEQQPQLGKRQTRAAYDKLSDKRSRPSYGLNHRLKVEVAVGTKSNHAETGLRRGPGRPPKIKAEPDTISPTRLVSPQSHRRRSSAIAPPKSPITLRSGATRSTANETSPGRPKHRSPSPPLTLQKVTFRVALPKPSILTPANAPPSRKYSTFKEFLEKDPLEPFAGQETMTPEQIKTEAFARHRIREAKFHGMTAGHNTSKLVPDKQLEPIKQFAHHDHLLGHISHFRLLLRQEGKEHRRKAEQLAHEAKRYVEEKRKRSRVKTAEELAREEMERTRLLYRNVVRDVDRLWLAVQAEVNSTRQRRFEEEQQAKIKSHLNRVLERTDEMLTRHGESELTSDMETTDNDDNSLPDSEDGTSDSEIMSASSSDTDSDGELNDPDEGLTAEQLKAKYESLPELDKLEEVRDVGWDSAALGSGEEDSDPDIEMDSEFESDDSNIHDDDDDDDNDEEDHGDQTSLDDDNDAGGLLSMLFSKTEVATMTYQDESNYGTPESIGFTTHPELTDAGLQSSEMLDDTDIHMADRSEHDVRNVVISEASQALTEDRGRTGITHRIDIGSKPLDHSEHESVGSFIAVNHAEDVASRDISLQTSPGTSITKQSEPESASSLEPQNDNAENLDSHLEEKPDGKTRVPSLLRGTLREYQHEGLDWLAKLYANGRSGILADEMGLGKTIQSIALLAHLAVEYEVWGPHLIVVPTSVMLNWEMEFKKFLPGFKILTYYGNLDERKQKRRGWMADDSFNVCITSYQLVLQDANSFKRRRWHYMILDEAHNIKNFRSERWQTMMTFNTRARLLLTGTPLQNNLTELWSLLFFLHYGQEGEDEDEAFAGLKEWSEWFKRPVESILEHGRQVLDQEDKEQVAKLHKVIRPFLLRRLKADVEKQMPGKYEHVEMCRLSKRQRQLYDGFMSRAQTKETLASGNYLSIINALMQLRKVCNHPDLFETRPINTSFAMSRSIPADYEIQDLILRRKLFNTDPLEEVDLDFLQLVPVSNEKISLIENMETVRQHAYRPFKALRENQSLRINRLALSRGQSRANVLATLENVGRNARLRDIDRTMYYEAYRHHQRPIYGRGLLEKLKHTDQRHLSLRMAGQREMPKLWASGAPVALLDLVQSVEARAQQLGPLVEQYGCVTPAVMATDLSTTFVTDMGVSTIRQELGPRRDPFHRTRMKLSIAFPDKRLLQYDCGKLQRLDRLLRNLQTGGHRALIFTQMTKVLDILEQFLNIHGHRYLRLDGATKIEQRQILTDRFNNDTRILCFILSSRSGGLGINLTGADTVIFYDLDWNPAMDRQCTDRAHRIGQTRDVHIYRFVSEHTIESNILRKAGQKQLLDDVVIQEGDFTTDYMNKINYRDMLDDQAEDDVAGAAMDRVLGNEKSAVAAFEQAEDQEDVSAAKVATKEVQHVDDGDFEDKVAATPQTGETGTPGPFGATTTANAELDSEGIHHIDDYMLKMQTFLVKDVPIVLAKDKKKRGRKRGNDHRRPRQR